MTPEPGSTAPIAPPPGAAAAPATAATADEPNASSGGLAETAKAVGLAAATMGANLLAVAFTVVFTG